MRAWLGTPKGQLQLIALTFLAAFAIAFGASTQRAFFEGYVREKYPAPTAATVEQASALEQGGTAPTDLAAVTALYQLWLQEPGAETRWPSLPSKLASAAPALTRELTERTFVAGSEPQADRAVAFATATRSAALAPALRLGLERSRRLGLTDRANRFETALAQLP